MNPKTVSMTVLLSALFYAAAGLSAEMHAYPAQGQSVKQQDKDEWKCHQWAVNKTGMDPLAMAKEEDTPPPRQPESVETGVRKGIFHGLIMGAIRGGDFARTTPIGAGVGALMALRRHRKAMEKQHEAYQQAYAAREEKLKSYDNAYSACMQGRGYAIK